MRRALQFLLATLLGAAGLGLAGSFLGALHPAGDSLAVFRLQIAFAVMVAATLLALVGGGRLAVPAALAAALAAAPAALSYLPRPEASAARGFALYQKNLLYALADPAPLVADILASGADVVTLQEVHRRNFPVLDALRAAYPSQAYCPYGFVGGTAVLSRWPALGEALCAEGGGHTGLRLESPEGPVWAISIHLHWPWPHGQGAQAARLTPILADLARPVLIGGDFNMVPWGTVPRRIAAATGTVRAGPTVTTLSLKGGLWPLAIDHVYLPEGWSATQEVRPELGSDHRGLLVRFAPLP